MALTREVIEKKNGSTRRVREVTFDEDRAQVRRSHTRQVLAALGTSAIGLMRWAGESNIAAACRRFAAQPWKALALIGVYPEN